MAKLLIIEDDLELAHRVRDWLAFEKHQIELVTNGKDALKQLSANTYDLIVLDWMLPEVTGIEVLDRYRKSGGILPVLMLTGRTAVEDKALGLNSGADDYLTKPFDLRELSIRIQAILRRPKNYVETIIKIGDVELDSVDSVVINKGDPVRLLPLEFKLLEFFMRHPDQTYSPQAILDSGWGADSDASVSAVRTYIKTLRKKLNQDEKTSLIQNIHGVGYKLKTPV
ncbi:MAG: response regulator transcription factor [Candidatus Melainabacteria bacterium]|nr:response regulator transcription factor [Candidatus Melainabacteria bacterium]